MKSVKWELFGFILLIVLISLLVIYLIIREINFLWTRSSLKRKLIYSYVLCQGDPVKIFEYVKKGLHIDVKRMNEIFEAISPKSFSTICDHDFMIQLEARGITERGVYLCVLRLDLKAMKKMNKKR